ncbi:MAG TPA: hypothetical protein VMX13_06855 [Sedimentisphaerales bacterium]|nr:hypothetical protein [Sedimentisphaerales bacterium]
MPLLYMFSDTDLAKGNVLEPEKESEQAKSSPPAPCKKKGRARDRFFIYGATEKTAGRKFREFCALPARLIGICGIGVLGYQGYLWFRQGYWRPLKAQWLLDEILPAGFGQWLHSGDSWSGINNIVSFLLDSSLGLSLIFAGLVLSFLISKFLDLFLRRGGTEHIANWRGR